MLTKMYVITRSNVREQVSFDKILRRLEDLATMGDTLAVDPFDIARETISGLHDGITTKELDTLAADISATRTHKHPDYNKFAARIAVSNLHKQTTDSYLECTRLQFQAGRVSEPYYEFVKENAAVLEQMIDYKKDYKFDYFGFKTLERAYLCKIGKTIVERPQHMIMRVAVQVHGLHPKDTPKRLELIRESYELMSDFMFTHASPTLFNSGGKKPQLSSCFLLYCGDDLGLIFDTAKNTAMISKWAGGIGISLSDLRAKGTYINGTGGECDGIVPLIKVLEAIARYVNQGGRRKGSFAMYLEPWHADIMDFLELRKPVGDENMRARDIFTALWIPDLFMERVEQGGKWSLMCPKKCPGLTGSYGKEFEELYLKYESEGRYNKQVNALDVWNAILESQFETGTPYMLYKDACNIKSNQKNIGPIRSSNLCTEILEYTSEDEIAVCNLGSISLPNFVRDGQFDFELLQKVTRVLTRNLNKIIDMNYYPVKEARKSNMRHRPIGIGIQGLTDVYKKFRYSFESKEAEKLNSEIFENIYYAALSESITMAQEDGPYETFAGSPFSQGVVQWGLWGIEQKELTLDWQPLLERLKKYGARNSLLTAPMPTATTAQIMGNTESFESPTTNYYVRQTMAGEYTIINEQLVRDLLKLGLWTQSIYEEIIYDNGSVQNIPEIPEEIKELYKTAYEIKQSAVIRQAAGRAPFIDQSQSLNICMAVPDFRRLSSCHFAGWKAGLKTGMYYLRTRPAADPMKFGLDIDSIKLIEARRRGEKDNEQYHWKREVMELLGCYPLDLKSTEEVVEQLSKLDQKVVRKALGEHWKKDIIAYRMSRDDAIMVCQRNKQDNNTICEMCSS